MCRRGARTSSRWEHQHGLRDPLREAGPARYSQNLSRYLPLEDGKGAIRLSTSWPGRSTSYAVHLVVGQLQRDPAPELRGDDDAEWPAPFPGSVLAVSARAPQHLL